MKIYFDVKPTTHKSECLICHRDIKKGELTLKAEQCMYPGYQQGRACIDCIKKGVVEDDKSSNNQK